MNKTYPEPKSWVKERFNQVFDGEIPKDRPHLLYSSSYYVALVLKPIDTSKTNWFTEIRKPFTGANYLGKLQMCEDDIKENDVIVVNNIPYRGEDVKKALTVIKLDLHDDVDIWFFDSMHDYLKSIGLGTQHGFIVIFPDLNLQGNTVKLKTDKPVIKQLNIPKELINKWLSELKIQI